MKAWILLFLKGLIMGAADIVPGVSGGTIAFITGIYERLLNAISQAPKALWLFCSGKFAEGWKQLDANFLLVLLSGILTSIFSLAGLIHWLLINQAIVLWAFFFGLIVASCWLVAKQIHRWRWQELIALVIGVAFAAWISIGGQISWGSGSLGVFFAGAVAICAMILPGISGSFLLVLIGMYDPIITAVKQLDLLTLVIFAAGCAAGILAFSHVLKFCMQRFRDVTLVFLLGIMLGSLLKVWPWKKTLTWQTGSDGELSAVQQLPITPWQYESLLQQDPQLLAAIAWAVCSLVLVLGLEYWATRLQTSARQGDQ